MIKWMILCSLCLSAAVGAETFPLRPDPGVTVGELCDKRDPDFAGYRYKEKIAICVRNVSQYRKAQAYALYGIREKCRREYTVDHFVPLSVGGSNSLENLWPEHRNVKATRQNLEQELYQQLANGLLSHDEVIAIITDAKMNPPSEIKPSRCK